MGLDTSSVLSADDLFVGRSSSTHQYSKTNNLIESGDGKLKMYDAVESLILNHANQDVNLRFMSLPGKFWKFEMRLANSWFEKNKKKVYFTAFERDYHVILSGAGYAPRSHNKFELPVHPGYREIEGLRVSYFKTNRCRWLNLDVNSALTLNDSMFKMGMRSNRLNKYKTRMEGWLHKFCRWDAIWLDYYGPASSEIGNALSNLHYHCRFDSVPVAVTILKGRELPGFKVQDRRQWLKEKLSGGGIWNFCEFNEVDYFEYSDGQSTMCNILGVLNVLNNKTP